MVVVLELAVVAVVVDVLVDAVVVDVAELLDRLVLVVPLLLPPEEELLTDRCVPGTCVEPLVSFTDWGWVGSACVLTSQSSSISL